jgi:hypothetical protein
MKQIELTSKLVVALIAVIVVFSAMTASPVAAQNAPKIPNSYITSGMIRDGEVKTADLANNAVTAAKIADGSIQEEDIAAGVISSGGIQDTHRVEGETVFIPAGTLAGADAGCPDGEILTGGGFTVEFRTKIVNSIPLESDAGELDEWRVTAIAPDDSEGWVEPWAVCGVPSP